MIALSHILYYASFDFLLLLAPAQAARKSFGCGNPLAPGLKQGGTGDSNSIWFTTSDGIRRHFFLHLPEVYTPTNAHALIFSYHGHGKNALEQEALSQFSNPAFNPSHLVVYPDGIDHEWQGDPSAETDDVGFTLDMIDKLTSTFCIDEDRIYAAGKSNGGGFAANILACDSTASQKIAAFAGISGAYYVQEWDSTDDECNDETATVDIPCSPGRQPIPIFETHGSADPVIPYYGGARRGSCLPTVPHFMTAWSDRNGLGSSNSSTSLFDGNVVKYEFGEADGEDAIETHYWINGLKHQWPSTVPNDDGGATFFNATPLIMEFFNRWTLPASTPRATNGAQKVLGQAR